MKNEKCIGSVKYDEDEFIKYELFNTNGNRQMNLYIYPNNSNQISWLLHAIYKSLTHPLGSKPNVFKFDFKVLTF